MTEEPKGSYFRQAILGPIGLPIAVLIGVAFMIVNLSRVFLAVSKNGSVLVAIVAALIIMLGATLAAARRRIRSRSLVALLALFAVIVGSAGAVAARHGERKTEKHESAGVTAEPSTTSTPTTSSPGAAPVASGPTVDTTTKSFAFTPTALQAKGGSTVTVHMTNNDPVLHNWALYEDQARTKPLFQGDTFTGPDATHDYTFPAPPAGTYYFRCDLHPTMTGTLKIA